MNRTTCINRRLFIASLTLILLAIIRFSSTAKEFEENGIRYNIRDGWNAIVASFDNDFAREHSSDVIIPKTINCNGSEYHVTSIANNAFADCTNITSVKIGSEVTVIGDYAFKGCSSLSKVILDDGDQEIRIGDNGYQKSLFSDCPLVEVIIGRNINYDTGSFHTEPFCNQDALKNVTITNHVTQIPGEEFINCTQLESITIPGSVTFIESWLFTGCTSLKEIIFEDSYSELRYHCFGAICDNTLEKLYIGRNIDFPANAGADSWTPFNHQTNLKEVTISNTVSYLHLGLFIGCSSLTSITIPASVTSIDKFVFSGCTSLKELIFEDGNMGLQWNTYGFESNVLEKVRLGRNFENVDKYRYNGSQSNLYDLTITNSVTNVDLRVFGSFPGPDEMIIPESVKSLRSLGYNVKTLRMFSYNIADIENVISYDMRNTKVIIDTSNNGNYEGISSCKYAEFFNDVTAECNGKLYGIVSAPEGYVFDKCLYSEKDKYVVEIGETSVKSTSYPRNGLFYRGRQVLSEELSDGYSFEVSQNPRLNCFITCGEDIEDSKVKSVVLNEAGELLNTIGLDNVEQVEVLKISGDINGTDVLTINRMHALKFLDLRDANIVEGGASNRVEYQTKRNTIGTYFIKEIEPEIIILPDNAAIIENEVFDRKKSIRTIILGNSVISIGYHAFYYCESLYSIVLPNTVGFINDGAFERCFNLTEISIPSSLPEINRNTFLSCDGLTKVTLGESISFIGESAFSYCHSLQSIKIPKSVKVIKSGAFFGSNALQSIELPNTLQQINYNAFGGTRLEYVVIPDSVISIEDYAFCNCRYLKEVSIGKSVKRIGQYALSNTKLERILSFNPLAPQIDETTFDSITYKTAILHIQKNAKPNYWLDPVWNKFANVKDNIVCLKEIPKAVYGDSEVDLAQFAPEGADLKYSTSNEKVAIVNENKLQIVGVGKTSIIADANGSESIELFGKERQFEVRPADLLITVEDVQIDQGQPIPEFTYIAEGLRYDDTLDDIDVLPEAVCEADENSPEGTYPIKFQEGYDDNYNISTKPATLTILKPSSIIQVSDFNGGDEIIEVFDTSGILLFKGTIENINLDKGIYILHQGPKAYKLCIK